MALSYAFSPDKGETPETIARRRQTADLIAARIFGKAPANVGEGLNAIGQALIARQMQSEATDAQKAGMASVPALFGGTGANPGANIAASITGQPPVTPSAAVASSPMGDIPPLAAPTTGKIYSNDEPSPLDPPSGQDRQAMIATILGEAGNQGPAGMNAVGSVIRNRAVSGSFGGDTPTGVVTAKNQFEPWNTPEGRARMARAAADPRQAAAADAAISAAYGEGGQAPNDPTNGATMFFDPKLQASLGRNVPQWAQGPGQDIGDHRFFGGAPMQPTMVADAGNAVPPVPMSGGVIGSAPPADRQAMAFAGPTAPQPLASPAGAPPVAATADSADALPANAAPAQGALPTAQAVQAATPGAGGPFPNVSTEDLTKYAMNQFVPAANRQVIAAEITRRATAAQQANDPLRQLQIKKAQQETDSQGKFAVIGEDNMGRKQYGFVDATTGKVTPYKPETAQAPDTGLENLHGEDFFAALQQSDPAIATQVRAVVEGRAPYPTGMILKTPYGQRLAQMVTQADPSFETGNATARVKVRNEFKSGGVASPAGQISAGNTALQHAGEMSDALERMKEDGGILPSIGSAGIPFVSHIANQLHNKAVQGTPSGAALNDFMTAKNHFSEEVTKFYAGSAGSEAERARALANLDAAKSLPELRSAIKTEANLMQGKVNALQERWRNGMGPLVKDFPLISKESQDAIDRVMKRAESSNAAPQAAPAVKEGATIVNPQTGERRIMQGGKWVPVT